MDGVTVAHPIAIRECLIFPGVRIDSTVDMERRIVTNGHVIDCR
jgi:ADP-glucose pyrophosphorylase